MHRLLIFIFAFPLFAFGQSSKVPMKADQAKYYAQAISDFIKTANKKNKTNFDTLYFGKRSNGLPDDFPNIKLPETIEGTYIKLISPEAGKKTQNECKSRIYVNLIGYLGRETAEFMFIVFSNGFEHQYDYIIEYKFDSVRGEFEQQKIQFNGPPFGKKRG